MRIMRVSVSLGIMAGEKFGDRHERDSSAFGANGIFFSDRHLANWVGFLGRFSLRLSQGSPQAFHDIEPHRPGDAFEHSLKGPFYCQGLLGMVKDHLGNHHLATLGLALDAVRQVHCGADNAVFRPGFRADVPHHHVSRMQADAHV